MSDDKDDESEEGQNPGEEAEEEALGRSFIADTPDEDPRFETTGTNTADEGGDSSDESEESSSEGDE
ncbi:hypothetical protein C454_18384 [Haloferax gibbonsii ATCC 33959]|uniref:Uncharacterized protein n=1 Tax=Haloferax gibbonsii (strain ATCC 33959 / DSM 4427 / JCM 8863 / NBRC 102184 / NCIMB 2188 / Ma 2.38) TaxID=1227459 RepID=M0GXQ5_HALGM|nr:hypothetical protein [Haloferax gibbonsii]ELZ76292.1 hypothetical protein C454_18384 [Haloferax gibbonsii ATCC 33959]